MTLVDDVIVVLYIFTVQYVSRLQSYLSSLEYGQLATLTGRYYAMDRDKRYERTKIAFEGLVKGEGERVTSSNLIQVTTLSHSCTWIKCVFFYCKSMCPFISSENGRAIQFEWQRQTD